MKNSYSEIACFLTNTCGEPVEDVPAGILPVQPAEEAWLEVLHFENFYPHVIQLTNGERGIYLSFELVHTDCVITEDIQAARKWDLGSGIEVWNQLVRIAAALQEHKFHVIMGYKAGPYYRHEIGIFLSWHGISIDKCNEAERLFEGLFDRRFGITIKTISTQEGGGRYKIWK